MAMVLALTGCDANDEHVAGVAQDGAVPASAAPVAADAEAFIAAAEQQLADSALYAAKIAWVNATYLNEDTDWLNARALAERTALAVRLAGVTLEEFRILNPQMNKPVILADQPRWCRAFQAGCRRRARDPLHALEIRLWQGQGHAGR